MENENSFPLLDKNGVEVNEGDIIFDAGNYYQIKYFEFEKHNPKELAALGNGEFYTGHIWDDRPNDFVRIGTYEGNKHLVDGDSNI